MTAEDRMHTALMCIVGFVVIVAIVLLCLLTNAFAQHPPEHQALHEKFYQNWMQPENRAISCCHDKDCAPAQSKMVNGAWYARHSDDEEWVEIPARKIKTERDSPDGRSHLCKFKSAYGTYVYCFLPAAGG